MTWKPLHGPPQPTATEPFCPGVGLLNQGAKRRDQSAPKKEERGVGNSVDQGSGVNSSLVGPQPGPDLLWAGGRAGGQAASGRAGPLWRLS